MTLLDVSSLPDSQNNTFKSKFYLDGYNQVTDDQFYVLDLKYPTQLKGYDVSMDLGRVAGTLTCTLYKNNIAIPGTVLVIDAANPFTNFTGALEVDFNVNDVLVAKVTTSGFAPLSNVGDIQVYLK